MGLHSTVYLDLNGQSVSYGPGDEIPEEHARRIHAHAFEDGQHPYSDDRDEDGDGSPDRQPGAEPPRNGKGASRDAWLAFAGEKDFDIPEGVNSRDEIIAALADAGVIEKQ